MPASTKFWAFAKRNLVPKRIILCWAFVITLLVANGNSEYMKKLISYFWFFSRKFGAKVFGVLKVSALFKTFETFKTFVCYQHSWQLIALSPLYAMSEVSHEWDLSLSSVYINGSISCQLQTVKLVTTHTVHPYSFIKFMYFRQFIKNILSKWRA